MAVQTAELDLLAVLKASQAISRETLLPTLRETLMRIVLQQAGAQRGWLVQPTDGRLEIRAEAAAEQGHMHAASMEGPASAAGLLPLSILQYVTRTHEPVILNDAARDSRFSSDECFARRHPRSVSCLPILRQGELAALVYLENDLAVGAFSADKLAPLELLSGQMAISLDNARLYADLHDSRAQLEAILENMVDGVVVIDRDRRVALVNKAAARLLGWQADRDAHISVDGLTARLGVRRPVGQDSALERALGGEVVPFSEVTLPAPPHGREVHLAFSAAPVRDERGDVTAVVTVVRDVTELVELDRLKDQFVRVTAHELKTPVAVIKGYIELLIQKTQTLPPEARLLVDRIWRGAGRIERIVTDLVYLSQLQLGRLKLVLEPVDLGALAAEVIASLPIAAAAERLSVRQRGLVVVEGDRLLLQQVFAHLLDNALRYSPGGGPVELDLRLEGKDAIVSVRDRGVGIPSDKQPHIFERLYRAHTDTPYDFGGMGIGVFLSREIVTLHGGAIWFESREGQGSTFTFRVPRISPRRGAARARGAATPANGPSRPR